jgi:hypothetical protein
MKTLSPLVRTPILPTSGAVLHCTAVRAHMFFLLRSNFSGTVAVVVHVEMLGLCFQLWALPSKSKTHHPTGSCSSCHVPEPDSYLLFILATVHIKVFMFYTYKLRPGLASGHPTGNCLQLAASHRSNLFSKPLGHTQFPIS